MTPFPLPNSSDIYYWDCATQDLTLTPPASFPGRGFFIANNGTNAVNYWPAVSGAHTVQAWVDDVNRIAESNETNNKTTASITVP